MGAKNINATQQNHDKKTQAIIQKKRSSIEIFFELYISTMGANQSTIINMIKKLLENIILLPTLINQLSTKTN
jgi:hypothetical protein